jgi:hypothetical protein
MLTHYASSFAIILQVFFLERLYFKMDNYGSNFKILTFLSYFCLPRAMISANAPTTTTSSGMEKPIPNTFQSIVWRCEPGTAGATVIVAEAVEVAVTPVAVGVKMSVAVKVGVGVRVTVLVREAVGVRVAGSVWLLAGVANASSIAASSVRKRLGPSVTARVGSGAKSVATKSGVKPKPGVSDRNGKSVTCTG